MYIPGCGLPPLLPGVEYVGAPAGAGRAGGRARAQARRLDQSIITVIRSSSLGLLNLEVITILT